MDNEAAWKDRIVRDPGILGGRPVIKGTRVPVQVIVGLLAGGETIESVCEGYHVTKEDVLAALTSSGAEVDRDGQIVWPMPTLLLDEDSPIAFLICRCGCGEYVRRGRVFVNKEHQLAWMMAGGAREMNQLLPLSARQLGGHVAGTDALASGRLRSAGLQGAERSREIADQFRKGRQKSNA